MPQVLTGSVIGGRWVGYLLVEPVCNGEFCCCCVPEWSVLFAPARETPAVEGARHSIGLPPVVPTAEQLTVPGFSRPATAPGVYVVCFGPGCQAAEPEGRLVLAPAVGLADELLLLGPGEQPGGVSPAPLAANANGEAQDTERGNGQTGEQHSRGRQHGTQCRSLLKEISPRATARTPAQPAASQSSVNCRTSLPLERYTLRAPS